MSNYCLNAAKTTWDPTKGLISLDYQDIYFPLENALEGIHHVFCRPNNLPGAWQGVQHATLAEIGFGTGLNFLVTAELWKEHSSPKQRLTYVSFEKHPLDKDTLTTLLHSFSLDESLRRSFLEAYPPPIRGIHRIHLSHNITLDLVYGDAHESLKDYQGLFDTWYLDGFNPQTNQELWNSSLFSLIADHSHSKTTFSTFSAAGFVRRQLQELGCHVERFSGFAGKRESLCGSFDGMKPKQENALQSAVVVGGGLAGSFLSSALLERGVRVTLLEKEENLAHKASGNPQGILLPYLRKKADREVLTFLAGYLYSLRTMKALSHKGELSSFAQPGIVHFAATKRLFELLSVLDELGLPADFVQKISAKTASEQTQTRCIAEAFSFPTGSLVSPPELCQSILASSLHTEFFSSHFHSEVKHLRHTGECWQVFGEKNSLLAQAQSVFLTQAHDVTKLSQTHWLPVEAIRGQIFQTPANNQSEKLSSILCYDGYCTPCSNGSHLLGASYHHNDMRTDPEPKENEILTAKLNNWCPDLQLDGTNSLMSRVSFRTSTYDRFPFVGQITDIDKLPNTKDKEYQLTPHKDLYCALGFGSRGLSSIPLFTESLVSSIFSEPCPLPLSTLKALSPERYVHRCLKRVEQDKLLRESPQESARSISR